MNGIFQCLTCYGQHKSKTCSVKGSGEDEIGTIFLIRDICDQFLLVVACDHSQIITLYTSHITQIYFALNLFTKSIVIFKIFKISAYCNSTI